MAQGSFLSGPTARTLSDTRHNLSFTYNFRSNVPGQVPTFTIPGVGVLSGDQCVINAQNIANAVNVANYKNLIFSIEFFQAENAGPIIIPDGDFFIHIPTTGFITRIPQPPIPATASWPSGGNGYLVSGCIPIICNSTSQIYFTKGENANLRTVGLLTANLVDYDVHGFMATGIAFNYGTGS
jgi:hypothetical protein